MWSTLPLTDPTIDDRGAPQLEAQNRLLRRQVASYQAEAQSAYQAAHERHDFLACVLEAPTDTERLPRALGWIQRRFRADGVALYARRSPATEEMQLIAAIDMPGGVDDAQEASGIPAKVQEVPGNGSEPSASVVSHPICLRDVEIGVLRLYWSCSRLMTADDLELLRELCFLLTVFVEPHVSGLNLGTQTLISTITHDLRGPLSAILGYAELLLDGSYVTPLATDQAEHVEIIHRLSLRTLQTIAMLSEAFKLVRGELPMQTERVPLAPIVQRAAEGNREQLDQRGQTLIISDQGAGTMATADPRWLETALSLLMLSISQQSPHGSTIMATLTAAPDEKHTELVFRVSPPKGQGYHPLSIGQPRWRLNELIALAIISSCHGTLIQEPEKPSSSLTIRLPW
ncbi:MAG: hypothetical protein Kow0047_23080 [Anaerolineae bacterium]